MRVNARSPINKTGVGGCECLRVRGGCEGLTDAHDRASSRIPRPTDDVLAVCVEGRIGEMRVAVDEVRHQDEGRVGECVLAHGLNVIERVKGEPRRRGALNSAPVSLRASDRSGSPRHAFACPREAFAGLGHPVIDPSERPCGPRTSTKAPRGQSSSRDRLMASSNRRPPVPIARPPVPVARCCVHVSGPAGSVARPLRHVTQPTRRTIRQRVHASRPRVPPT